MPLGSLERSPPPFFKQGTSALTKLMLFSALSFGLMFADQHYNIVQPARWVLSLIVYPVQWVALRPQVLWDHLDDVLESKQDALSAVEQARSQLLKQSVRASQVEQLTLENRDLRQLLQLRERLGSRASEQWLDLAATRGLPFELRLSRLAAWVRRAEEAGLPYGLRLRGVALAPDLGPEHFRACMEALALAEEQP